MAIFDGIEYTKEDIIQAIYDLENNKYNEFDFKTQDIRNFDYQIVWQEKLYTAKRVFECLAKNKNIVIGSSFQPNSLISQLREMKFEIKQQSKFGNRKDGFLEYLKNVVLPITPSYKNYIKKFDLDKIIMYILKKDIFAISDVSEIEFMFSQLKKNEEWKAYDRQNGNGIPSAILRKHYKNYLEQEEMKLTNLSVKDLRQKLITKYQTKIEINDNPQNYTAFVYRKKNIAEIHYIEKFKDEFKIVLNYEKLNDAYKASVERVPDSWGWTLNGIFRINSVDSYKTAIEMIDYILNNNIKQKCWLYAAGERSSKWEEFYNDGIMALGWDYLGDYRQYNTQDDLASKIQQHRGDSKYPMNVCKAIWEFADVMNIGDVIYVKQGLEPVLLGRGIVVSDYIYDSNRQEYKNIRKVNWTHKGQFKVDFADLEIRQWNQKTLTDVSENKYGDFCKKIESIFKDKNETKSEKNKMINQPLNQILYGPPGTGKTYSTKGLIELIIKENLISSQKKNINVDELYWYSAIALAMYKNDKTKKYKVGVLLQQEIIKEFAQSKNSKNVYSTVISQLQMHTDENSETVNYARRLMPYLFNKDENSEWYLTEEGIVFVEESFKEYLSNETRKISNNDFVRFITFHQAYSYEEFVEGIRVNLEDDCEEVKYSLQNGIFKEICIEANADPNNKYVIVIDEINRGDISKIFGELITLIENDKRVTPNGERSFENTEIQNNQLLVTLPYSKKKFGVPSNLYIIGTMNTADRSIALLDIALRRRFDFISTYPNAEIIGTDGALTEVNGIDIKLFLNKINKRIEAYLDKDHTIGHSYLMDIHSYEDFLYKFKNRILPLLLEYFYNDYEKVAKILNQDDFENSENQIIQKECLIDDIPTYNINEKYPLEAFKKVCK